MVVVPPVVAVPPVELGVAVGAPVVSLASDFDDGPEWVDQQQAVPHGYFELAASCAFDPGDLMVLVYLGGLGGHNQ